MSSSGGWGKAPRIRQHKHLGPQEKVGSRTPGSSPGRLGPSPHSWVPPERLGPSQNAWVPPRTPGSLLLQSLPSGCLGHPPLPITPPSIITRVVCIVVFGGFPNFGVPPPVSVAVVCPLLCQNGGICAHPSTCLCPPQFTGRFCHLPANLTRRGAPQNAGGPPPAPQELTQSVYTLPLANHREDEDGAQSLVTVLVRHPPAAPVAIHGVERVRGGEGRGATPPPPPHGPPRVLALSGPSPHRPEEEDEEGFGYCFRVVRGEQCSAPLPGLRTRRVCCRGGGGAAWGVSECQRCPGDNGDTGDNAVSPGVPLCPPGFQRLNGTCQDIDECQQGALCRRGLCTNTRGGFTCRCPPGFLLDSARAACISQQVLSEARGPCFRVLGEGRRCALPTLRNITRQICCCSRVGKAWGGHCERCPPFGSAEFREICPAGPGYHYSASDLRIDTRYLGPRWPRCHPCPRCPRRHPTPGGGSHPCPPPCPRGHRCRPPPEVVVVPRGGAAAPRPHPGSAPARVPPRGVRPRALRPPGGGQRLQLRLQPRLLAEHPRHPLHRRG
ncbi:hypothetical protein Q9233_017534 [Columba guinea]|nr:hypothetical protein Q9233_017534 [Columba guinea]